MKILGTCQLLDICVKHRFTPLAEIELVEKITIVRSIPGPPINKVQYVCPYPWLNKFIILRILSKLFLMFYCAVKERPNIIISFYLKASGIIALVVGKLLFIPVNYNVMSGPEEFKLFQFGNITNYAIPNKTIRNRLIEKFFLSIARKFDSITTTGSQTMKYLIDNGVNKNKVRILPDSVDLNLFKPTNSKKIYDIITIARLDPVKKIEHFISITSELVKINPNFLAAIGGDGIEMKKLKLLAKKFNLEKNIVFLGFVDDVQNYLNKSKIFVLNSEREGLPMTIIESMGTGIPCISSNVGNISDLIENGKNSFIVDDNSDIKCYSKIILKLTNNKKLYDKISSNAIKSVNENYSYHNCKLVWKNIFRELG